MLRFCGEGLRFAYMDVAVRRSGKGRDQGALSFSADTAQSMFALLLDPVLFFYNEDKARKAVFRAVIFLSPIPCRASKSQPLLAVAVNLLVEQYL